MTDDVRCAHCDDEVEAVEPIDGLCPACVEYGERWRAEQSARECEGDYLRMEHE